MSCKNFLRRENIIMSENCGKMVLMGNLSLEAVPLTVHKLTRHLGNNLNSFSFSGENIPSMVKHIFNAHSLFWADWQEILDASGVIKCEHHWGMSNPSIFQNTISVQRNFDIRRGSLKVAQDEGMHCILQRDSYLFTHNGAIPLCDCAVNNNITC